MSREIKFRAWDNDFGAWLQDTNGNEYFVSQNGKLNFIDTEDGKIRRYPNANEVCFYTGLKDKNGKEIYEGDIFSWGSHTAEVIFENGYFMFNGMGINPPNKTGEVIGNTMENPELLEAK